jgi:hypothetical protein
VGRLQLPCSALLVARAGDGGVPARLNQGRSTEIRRSIRLGRLGRARELDDELAATAAAVAER